jgi:hypothetical protein
MEMVVVTASGALRFINWRILAGISLQDDMVVVSVALCVYIYFSPLWCIVSCKLNTSSTIDFP